jgi:hypothetical protein
MVQVAAHIEGGTARLTEAWVSIMRCQTKADRGGPHCGASAGCARYAPGQDTCEHVSAGQCDTGNGLRSRERRFESCRGYWSEA